MRIGAIFLVINDVAIELLENFRNLSHALAKSASAGYIDNYLVFY
jgi:hypothetical protein